MYYFILQADEIDLCSMCFKAILDLIVQNQMITLMYNCLFICCGLFRYMQTLHYVLKALHSDAVLSLFTSALSEVMIGCHCNADANLSIICTPHKVRLQYNDSQNTTIFSCAGSALESAKPSCMILNYNTATGMHNMQYCMLY